MSDVDDLVKRRTELARELSSWQQKAAVAKADEERIKKEVAEYIQILKKDFDCDSFEDAKDKLKTLIAEATSKCDALEDKLNDLRSL